MEPTTELVPIQPDEAVEKYLSHRETEGVSEKTVQSHRYRLKHFIRWCEENDIESMSGLSPRDMQDFRNWRKRDGDLNNVSWLTQMTTLRVFMTWAESYQAVPNGFSDNVKVPDIEPNEDVRDTKFSEKRAEQILDYLETYKYASTQHTLFAILWHTGIRIGAARSLDLSDFNRPDGYIELHHRPESDTPLKNGSGGERPITLAHPEATLLSDYIDDMRHDVTDDHGRHPLFTTKNGRPHITTFRGWVYQLSRPCIYLNGDCPHGRNLDECAAANRVDDASKCPSAFSPHTIRRSSITKWLADDVPKEAVSDRMNANKDALDKHYDKRTEKGKMKQRKEYFE